MLMKWPLHRNSIPRVYNVTGDRELLTKVPHDTEQVVGWVVEVVAVYSGQRLPVNMMAGMYQLKVMRVQYLKC